MQSTVKPKAAPVEETEPEPFLSVACHCLCNCPRRPNRRITCERCNLGVGPGCCARNAEGGMPDIGATTCICHRCLEEGPPPQPNPQEEKSSAWLLFVHPCELDNCSCQRTALPFVWVPGEEQARCHECVELVQEFSRLVRRAPPAPTDTAAGHGAEHRGEDLAGLSSTRHSRLSATIM